MGRCNNCKKPILYNKYKHYRGKILCPECYSTRLERKAEAKIERNRQAELVKMVTPSRRAKKKAKEQGLDLTTMDETINNDESKTAEDSR